MPTFQKVDDNTASALGGNNGIEEGKTMDKTVRTLLNGYERPAILSNTDQRDIVFLNDAALQLLDITQNQAANTRVYDLFNSQRIIQQDVVWERGNNQFKIDEEKLNIDGSTYIRSIISPIEQPKVLDLLTMQKEMAQLVVHRFHSPLNGISGFTELLNDSELDHKQQEYLQAIEDGLADFKDILSNMNDLAQDIEVQFNTINVQKFCQQLFEKYEQNEKKRINLTIDPDLIELQSDIVILEKIITELLDNALQFSDGRQNVELHFRSDNTIRVTNFGSQIPQTFTRKMFYPFFSNKARGIGLGLSKCVYYCRELGYQIILAENSSVDGISFDIQM